MTNNPLLDKHIKEKLGNYSPDVPGHIWENIMAEKEKRKPAGFWFSFLNKNLLLLFGVIVLAGGGIFIYKNVNTPSAVKTNEQEEAINTAKETANNADPVNNNSTTGISIEPGTDNISVVTDIPPTITPADNQGNTIPVVKDFVKDPVETKVSNNKPGNKSNNLLQTAANNRNELDVLPVDENGSAASVAKKQKRAKGSAVVSYHAPEMGIEDGKVTSAEFLLNRVILNPEMIRFERGNNMTIQRTQNPNLNIPCPEAEKNAAGNKRYFEIYGGPDYAFRSLSDTGNSPYLQKRKESTSFTSAFSVGMRYTRVFGNGMSFRTGINYSQINEKFKFAEGNIIQLVYNVNGNGDTIGSYATTSTRYKTTYNKFRTIDVPILIGYELGNGRLHANFNAGAIVNLYSWQKGDVLDTAYQPISITTGKAASPYQFKTNVGIGFLGAISVYYKLTDRWHILAEPYFRYNFSPASKTDMTFKQKYNTMGLKLGIRMDF